MHSGQRNESKLNDETLGSVLGTVIENLALFSEIGDIHFFSVVSELNVDVSIRIYNIDRYLNHVTGTLLEMKLSFPEAKIFIIQ